MRVHRSMGLADLSVFPDWAHRPKTRLVWLVGALLWALGFPGALSATEPPSLTIPYLRAQVDLDGRLQESVWTQAALVQDFQVFEPIETGEAPGATRAHLFWNETGLYIGFHCTDPDPTKVRASFAPREDVNQDDQVGIYLDTYNDDRQAFVFYLNALGIQQDARMIEGVGWQQSWDTELNSYGLLHGDGYEVEVHIPFRSLRFPNREEQTWGILLTRKFAAAGVKAGWPKITREKTNTLEQAATLHGIRGVRAGRALELRPELLLGLEPGPSGVGAKVPLPGLWARYGLSSNLSLDLTLNPDFSQVEADPSQLDLNSRYALYTDEMRPFFLEGYETLQAPSWSLYTRSINAPLAGLKLTGKEGRTGMGLLLAYDSLPLPTVTSEEVGITPGFSQDALVNSSGDPLHAMVVVGRVTQDVGNASVVGAGVSLKELVDPASGALGGFNRVASADAHWQLGEAVQLNSALALSQTGARGEGIAETALDGGAFQLSIVRQDRLNRLYAGVGHMSTGFRSETAFMTRPGFSWLELYGHRKLEPALKGVVYLRPMLFADLSRDEVAPDHLYWSLNPGLANRFDGQRYFDVFVPFWQEWVGDSVFNPWQLQLRLRSDRLRVFTWNAYWREGLTVDYGALEEVWEAGPEFSARWRPAVAFQLDAVARWRVALNVPEPVGLYFLDVLQNHTAEAPRWTQWTYRLVGAWMFGRKLGLRAIADFKHTDRAGARDDRLYSQLLLTWIEHPGTALYLGGGHSVDWSSGMVLTPPAWQIFLKASYNWRL